MEYPENILCIMYTSSSSSKESFSPCTYVCMYNVSCGVYSSDGINNEKMQIQILTSAHSRRSQNHNPVIGSLTRSLARFYCRRRDRIGTVPEVTVYIHPTLNYNLNFLRNTLSIRSEKTTRGM